MVVYGQAYANEYDQIYSDKDYQAECDLIEKAFFQFGKGDIKSVVDFGCGTGNHSIPLALRNYSVTGVDLSGEMLRVAQQKSSEAGVLVNWKEGDIRGVDIGRQFDAGLFMFSVLGYLLPNEDVMNAFLNARRHIRSGGVLAFDVWYGPAVLSIKPSDRAKVISDNMTGKVIRIVTPRLDVRHHVCNVHYHLWRLVGDRVVSESEELHPVRFFFSMELDLMLKQSGFELVSLTEFPTLDRLADETTWNAFVVAVAI